MPRTLYPPVEPRCVHRFQVSGGHDLYVEEVGAPQGIPAVFLHGGPGGGLVPAARQFFDPDRYRVVLVDQRGSGLSTPRGSVVENTTADLIADLEVIRAALGIRSWLLFGGSWGSTLALAYAQSHPDRVTGLILRGILLLRAREREWFYQGGLSLLQPEEWARFIAPVPEDERADVLGAYHRRLTGPDGPVAGQFAGAWMRWEAVNSSLVPDPALLDLMTGDDAALPMARILAHYMVNGGFLDDGGLLDGVERIRHLPCVVVQGRYDLCCPPDSAYELVRRWPEAEVHMIQAAGHASSEPGILDRLIRATDAFADSVSPAR